METQKTVPTSDEAIIQAVHDAYSAHARTGADSSYSQRVAQAFGYTPEQLQSVPVEAYMGLSCGNPVAAATLREGDTVLDLGCGGGIDIFLAASKIGPLGSAVGLDLSSDMIKRARENAKRENLYPPNVAFVQACLTESLPIASNSIDCVLSNCVINLLPLDGKASLLREVCRVLKPGGRLVADDIIAKQNLPDGIRKDLASYVSCISGAIQIDQYKDLISGVGLQDAIFADTHGDLNIYYQTEKSAATSSACCESTASCGLPKPAPDFDANMWIASYQIYALKPKLAAPDFESAKFPSPLLKWWDAYPAVQSTTLPAVSNQELAEFMRHSPASDYAVIDVRRNDHAGGHVRGSYQWPAQTFYDDIDRFYQKFKDVEKVIFYCGSSNGRGPRCAGWYQDHLNVQSNTASKAFVLQGGIKAWLEQFRDVPDLVDRDPTD